MKSRELIARTLERLESLGRRTRLSAYWHEAYRPPMTGIDLTGLDPRRGDFALWYLQSTRVLKTADVKTPQPISWEDLARVHRADYLETLFSAESLAKIFAVEPSDIPIDSALNSLRLACGGTLAGARETLRTGLPVLNLSGGFHHAAPGRGAGFCAFNDVAVAIAALRSEGFSGKVAILDLDAHPPDGTAECVHSDAAVWHGSISGAVWGELPGVHEHVLPRGAGDAEYLATLDGLLREMPEAGLVFVLAGGDVLSGDPLGALGLTLGGVRERDRRVAARLSGTPSVWMPAGGYRTDAWKVVAGTALELAGRHRRRIPEAFDPLSVRYRHVARTLDPSALGNPLELDFSDVEADLHLTRATPNKLLGFYTVQGFEYALSQYGIVSHLERLGYSHVSVRFSRGEVGERASVFGDAQGATHLLIESEVSRRTFEGREFLFVNWLSLRHPIAKFGAARPQLPGQEVPGLGLSREIGELLNQIARRLGLVGLVFCPAHYHLAFIAKDRFHFAHPDRQARFEALQRTLSGWPLIDATRAIAAGRVTLNGTPYVWEASEMIFGAPPPSTGAEGALAFAVRDRVAAGADSS